MFANRVEIKTIKGKDLKQSGRLVKGLKIDKYFEY